MFWNTVLDRVISAVKEYDVCGLQVYDVVLLMKQKDIVYCKAKICILIYSIAKMKLIWARSNNGNVS